MSEVPGTPPAPVAWPAGYFDDEIDLREYIEVLRRRWSLVIGIPIVAVIVSALLSFFVLPPTYEASAGVLILKARTAVQFEPKIRTDLPQDAGIESRREALQALATTPAMAALVIDQLGDVLPEEDREVDTLLEKVKANLEGDLLTIQAEHEDPQVVTQLANTWAKTYITYVNPLFSEVVQRPETLAGQVQEADVTYQNAQAAVVQFLADNPIQRLERERDDLQRRIKKQYNDLFTLDYLIADIQSMRDQLAQNVGTTVPASMGNNLATLFLRARAFTASSGAQLETQLQIDPAAWIPATQDAATWQQEMDSLLNLLNTRRSELAQWIESRDWEQQLLDLQSELERQYARRRELINQRDLAWETFTSLQRKYTEVKVATEAPDLQVSVAMQAVVPENPVRPRKLLNMALAGALGLMTGVFGAFMLEFLSETPETTEAKAE